MGDWAVTTYWGDGPRPKPRPAWFGGQGARAARVGWLGASGLWQLEVLLKYGSFDLDPEITPWLVGVGPGSGYLREASGTQLRAGWNYILSERPEDASWFRAAADLLGPYGPVAVVADGDRTLLCLADVIRCTGPDATWEMGGSHADPSPEARVVEALALAETPTRRPWRQLVLGLWTAAYGYVHTGNLTLALDDPLQWHGGAERRLTGEHNDIGGREVVGPYAESTFFPLRPVAAPAVPWPHR